MKYVTHQPVTDAQSAIICLQHIVTRFQQEPEVVFVAACAVADVVTDAVRNGESVDPLQGASDPLPAAPE